jgi:hypothetical protein
MLSEHSLTGGLGGMGNTGALQRGIIEEGEDSIAHEGDPLDMERHGPNRPIIQDGANDIRDDNLNVPVPVDGED